MYDVTMTSFLYFHQQKGLKAKNVILTHNDAKLKKKLTQWTKLSLYT